MSKNKKNKDITLESHDNAAVKTSCQETNEVSEKGKKSFGRKVWIYIKPWLNVKFLMTYGLVWSWHILLYVGLIWGNPAIKKTCITIYGILWLPWCQENLFQVPLAIYLYNRWFKENNEALEAMKIEAKNDFLKLKDLWHRKPWLIILITLAFIALIVGGWLLVDWLT